MFNICFLHYFLYFCFAACALHSLPKQAHVGACKPVWQSGCEGGGHFGVTHCYNVVLCGFAVCFCVPYPSKLMLELVNQSGRLVVRGEAILLLYIVTMLCFFVVLLCVIVIPYPSKLMLELVNQSGRLVVRGEAVFPPKMQNMEFFNGAAELSQIGPIAQQERQNLKK